MTNTKSMVLDSDKIERINSTEPESENRLSKRQNFRSIRITTMSQVEDHNNEDYNEDYDNEDEDNADDDPDGSKKRKKLTCDERLKRNRERNRMHARKTRERKKKQSFALQQRIKELQSESNKLRQIIDDRFTACALLGLSQQTNQAGENIPILSSATICKKTDFENIDSSESFNIEDTSPTKSPTNKRVRRRGKYSPQERERIRRERNRMHAKRTRDKKKMFLEASEQIISEMENESRLLREYLVSAKLISVEYCAQSEHRAMQSKKELALLKAYSLQHDGNDDEQDDEDDEDQDNEVKYIMNQFESNEDVDDDQEGYHSGSDEKGSWGGSNDGSNNDSSNNGETSGDGSDKGRTFSSSSSSSSSQYDHARGSSREGSTGSDNGNSGTGSDNGDNGHSGSDNGDNGNSGDENSDNGNGDNNSGEDSEKYRSTPISNFFNS